MRLKQGVRKLFDFLKALISWRCISFYRHPPAGLTVDAVAKIPSSTWGGRSILGLFLLLLLLLPGVQIFVKVEALGDPRWVSIGLLFWALASALVDRPRRQDSDHPGSGLGLLALLVSACVFLYLARSLTPGPNDFLIWKDADWQEGLVWGLSIGGATEIAAILIAVFLRVRGGSPLYPSCPDEPLDPVEGTQQPT